MSAWSSTGPWGGVERAVLHPVDAGRDGIGNAADRVGMGGHGQVVAPGSLDDDRELLCRVLRHKRIGTGREESAGRHDFDPLGPALAAELDRFREVCTGIGDTAEVPAMAVGAGDRGPRGQNVRPGAGGGAAFVADGDGDEVTVTKVTDRGDARLQRLTGMLTRPVQQDVIRGGREGLRWTVWVPD